MYFFFENKGFLLAAINRLCFSSRGGATRVVMSARAVVVQVLLRQPCCYFLSAASLLHMEDTLS